MYFVYVATVVLSLFAVLLYFRTKKAYEQLSAVPIWVSIAWWVLDVGWTCLTIVSAVEEFWPLPGWPLAYFVFGLGLLIVGCALTLAGVLEFKSLRKVSGLEVDRLITSGIYKWSRNPQFLGFYFSLFGISLMGKTGFGIFLSTLAVIYCHVYIVTAEEPFLERVFGEEYSEYKSRTHRYLGLP